jgi:hypothetical protein
MDGAFKTGAALLFTVAVGLPAAAREQTAEIGGFSRDLVASLRGAAAKLVALAEVTPAERFSWRPTEEVRTISEVYMHIVGSNYQLPPGLGAEPPERVEIPDSGPFGLMQQRRRWVQEITDKEDVIAWLRDSFDYALEAIPTITDLDTEVAPFGFNATKRAYFLILQSHAHEHLGQSIAYARSIGVVPPWSQQAQQARSASVAQFRDGGAYGAVIQVDERFGNLGTNLVATDLEALGIQLGGSFVLRHEETTVHVLPPCRSQPGKRCSGSGMRGR